MLKTALGTFGSWPKITTVINPFPWGATTCFGKTAAFTNCFAGGLIVNVMKEEIAHWPGYAQMEEMFSSWEAQGLWTCAERVLPEERFRVDKDALIHVYRVKI